MFSPVANPLQKVNCQDYRIILRKDLTNSDVGNIGRIVLPKVDTYILLIEFYSLVYSVYAISFMFPAQTMAVM
jgi:hypothetical protein